MLPLAQAVEDGHHIMPPVDTRRERPATPGAAVDPATKVESTAERAKRYRRERNLATPPTAEADKLHGRLVECEQKLEALTAETKRASSRAGPGSRPPHPEQEAAMKQELGKLQRENKVPSAEEC